MTILYTSCKVCIPANFFWDISVRFLSWEFWDFCRRHDHFQRSPKSSEEVRNLPKTSEVCRRRSYRENAYPQNQRSWGRYCYLFIYTWFSFLTWVWVNTFLEIGSSKTATTHIFQSGVRNWPAGVSRREIEVFNPQAGDSRLRRESWQVYNSASRVLKTTRALTILLVRHCFIVSSAKLSRMLISIKTKIRL